MPPRDLPPSNIPATVKYTHLPPTRTPAQQRERQRQLEEAGRRLQRQRLVREHDERQRAEQQLIDDLLNFEINNDLMNFHIDQQPMPTFEGEVIPPPPPIQRQTAGRVTAAQNQQNIQNQLNQPPPRFL